MDKIFPPHDDIPTLPKERFDQMAELAMSYHQYTPGNENVKSSWSASWSFKWIGALSAAACVVLMIGVMSVQTDITPTAPTSVQTAQADDAYDDITEIAILATLDSF